MVKQGKRYDYNLIAVVGFLILFGIIILTSASTPVSQQKFGNTYYLLSHQLLSALIPGILLAFLLSKIKLNFLKKWAPRLLLLSLFLMAIVFLPKIGIRSGSAARWISLGFISFQPSEFLKLSFILYLASWLESRNKNPSPDKKLSFRSARIKKKSSFKFNKNSKENLMAFFVIIILMALLLYLQSDIGTFVIIMATAVLMYFFAKAPLWHIVLIFLFGCALLLILIKVAPYRLERISVFLSPESDPLGISYQVEQSLFAVGSGGISGLGFGMSLQKFGLLPHAMSDSIFAVLAEETGFVGSTILILLFLLFLWQGYKIGKNSPDMFSQLTALGITSWILIQAFVNIGAMIRILPLTGIPLPFISYGGTALFVELAAVGILLNISRPTKIIS